MDPAEHKVGLSIKAALDEPDLEAVQAYFESQPTGDGSATLGDVMSPEMLGSAAAARTGAEQAEDGTAEEGETDTKAPAETDDDAGNAN
jgi:hypothetical protein